MTYTEKQYAKLEQRRREKREVKRRKKERRHKVYANLYTAAKKTMIFKEEKEAE